MQHLQFSLEPDLIPKIFTNNELKIFKKFIKNFQLTKKQIDISHKKEKNKKIFMLATCRLSKKHNC